MVTLHAFGDDVLDFEALVRSFPIDTFASPRRSTVPLLDYWREPEWRWRQLEPLFDAGPPQPVALSFEHAVRVRKGHGKPSYTDLMLLTPQTAVAIEAKCTEPPYDTVADWLGTSPSQNRQDVLRGWLELISGVAGCPLAAEAVGAIPYQLIHRAASACSIERPIRIVVYHTFGDHSSYYTTTLGRFAAILRNGRIRFATLETPVRKTTRCLEMEARWSEGRRDLGEAIRNALLEGPLFEFEATAVRSI